MHVIRALVALSLIVAAACGGTGSTASPSPTATSAAASPTPTASSAPSSPAASPSTAPSGTAIPLPTTAQVAAAGNGVVWMLVADHLYRSTDKGVTWAERTWPPQGGNASIAFVSDREGWSMTAGSPATQCQSQKVAIAHTSDGGATWSGIDTTGIADALCKGPLAFSDAQRGYLSTWSPNDRPVIYRSADGGRTWQASQPLPDPAGFTTQAGGFTLRPGPVSDFGSVQLVYASGQAKAFYGYVFKSTDGGATWTPVSGSASEGGVVIITPMRWIQISSPGDSKETTDGGASWHGFATDYQQAAPIAPQIAFGDAQTGYATVRGGLSRTTDGGLHWSALKTPGT